MSKVQPGTTTGVTDRGSPLTNLSYSDIDALITRWKAGGRSDSQSVREQIRAGIPSLFGAPAAYLIDKLTAFGPGAKSLLSQIATTHGNSWWGRQAADAVETVKNPALFAAYQIKQKQLSAMGNLYHAADVAVSQLRGEEVQEGFATLYSIIQHSGGAPVAHALEEIAKLGPSAPKEAYYLVEFAEGMHADYWMRDNVATAAQALRPQTQVSGLTALQEAASQLVNAMNDAPAARKSAERLIDGATPRRLSHGGFALAILELMAPRGGKKSI